MATKSESEWSTVTSVERVSDRELVIKRLFRAKPRLVFDAMTKPELLRRWWAPKSIGLELVEITGDPRVGGAYRWVFGKKGQPAMAFSGIYKELVPGELVCYTQIFEPMREAGEGLITAVFQAHDEAFTRFTQRELYPSKTVLDGAINSGMERGARESLEQLEALFSELR